MLPSLFDWNSHSFMNIHMHIYPNINLVSVLYQLFLLGIQNTRLISSLHKYVLDIYFGLNSFRSLEWFSNPKPFIVEFSFYCREGETNYTNRFVSLQFMVLFVCVLNHRIEHDHIAVKVHRENKVEQRIVCDISK